MTPEVSAKIEGWKRKAEARQPDDDVDDDDDDDDDDDEPDGPDNQMHAGTMAILITRCMLELCLYS